MTLPRAPEGPNLPVGFLIPLAPGDTTLLPGDMTPGSLKEHAQSIGQKEVHEVDRAQIVRKYICRWVDRETWKRAFLGFSSINGGLLSRFVPYSLTDVLSPPPNNDTYLYATKVEAEGYSPTGWNSNDRVGIFDQAMLTVTYSTLPYDVLPDSSMPTGSDGSIDESSLKRYVSIHPRPGAEFFTVNPTNQAGATTTLWYFVSAAETAPPVGFFQVPFNSVPKLRVTVDLAITWHAVPTKAVPSIAVNPTLTGPSTIEKTIGTINKTQFASRFPKGTLLLLGAEMRPLVSALGQRIWDITYYFKYWSGPGPATNINHTFLYSPGTALSTPGFYEAIAGTGGTNQVSQSDGINNYDWREFSLLFKPP